MKRAKPETVTYAPLTRAFFERDPLVVARQLLNKLIVVGEMSGRIIEVEAYAGAADPASHAFRGRTPRNATMFGPAGHLYVYFTYGMHYCANIVCGPEGEASAVLLRALEPCSGVSEMIARRGRARSEKELCSGPARLCEALGIDRSQDGCDLLAVGAIVSCVTDDVPPPSAPLIGARVGLSARVGEAANWPWRFGVPGTPGLSPVRWMAV